MSRLRKVGLALAWALGLALPDRAQAQAALAEGGHRVQWLHSPAEWIVVSPMAAELAQQLAAMRADLAAAGFEQSAQASGPCGQASQTGPAGQPDQAGPNAPADGQETAQLQAEQRRVLVRHWAVPAQGRAFSLDTRYGRVQVNPWAKAEIRVEVELVARAETAAAARQVLDALGVQWLDYDARTGGVAVSTQLGRALHGRAPASRYEVNYTVWLPRTTALRLYNSFGETVLAGDFDGPTELAVEYGSLRTGRLDGPQNLIRLGNSDGTLAYAGRASIDVSYARLRLSAGNTVDLRNHYSDIDIGTVQDLTVHSKYGDVALGTVRNLRGSSGYSRFSVERLGEAMDMALRYCPDFVVRDTGPNFRQITLDGGYSSIRLGFAEAPGFRFDVRTEQGQLLADPRQVHVISQENGPRSSDVLGVFGALPARNPGNVSIRVNNGTVRFVR